MKTILFIIVTLFLISCNTQNIRRCSPAPPTTYFVMPSTFKISYVEEGTYVEHFEWDNVHHPGCELKGYWEIWTSKDRCNWAKQPNSRGCTAR